MLALLVAFLFATVASATRVAARAAPRAAANNDTVRIAKDALHTAQPYLSSALQAVRDANLVEMMTSLARYLPALVTGQAGALAPEVQAAGQAALAWVVLAFVALSIVSMIVSLGLKLAKLGIMVAIIVALVNFNVNKDYLMASLGF